MAVRTQDQSAWRWFPWVVAAFMGMVIVVNGGLIWSALSTFPGRAGGDGFDLSNRYNAVLERAQAQAALGWVIAAETDDRGHVMIDLIDRGQAIRGAKLDGTARRPLGAEQETILQFHEVGQGRYVADETLEMKGQWDVSLSISSLGHHVAVTRRVAVK